MEWEIDYDALFKLLVQRKKLSKKKYDAYLEDEHALKDDLSAGKTILKFSWDDGSYSGGHCVIQWKGLYFIDACEMGYTGPFETLEEVLGHEVFSYPIEYPVLKSDVLSLDQLLSVACRIVSAEVSGTGIYVNGTRYVLQDEELVPRDE